MNKVLISNIKEKKNQVTFTYDNGIKGKLYFVTDTIIRLMLEKEGTFSGIPSIMKEIDVPDENDHTVATGGTGQSQKVSILVEELKESVYPSTWDEYTLYTKEYCITIDPYTAKIMIQTKKGQTIFIQEGQPLISEKKKHIGLRVVSDPNEYFFGGGTQNGFYNLKGKKIQIENQNMWTEGGVASPVPFFFSTKGYGMLFNTFTKGSYSFHTPKATYLKHEDTKLDAFIILGTTPANIIHGYHQLTGKPHLSPLYTYYPAHLNAYNRDYWVEVTQDSDGAILFPDGRFYKEYQPICEKTFNTGYRVGTIEINGQKLVPNVSVTKNVTFIHTDEKGNPTSAIQESLNGENNNYMFSARAIIDRYNTYDLPLGWFLPNDGYGAGYGQSDTLDADIENLAAFGQYARKNHVELGLWTQENLTPKDKKNPKKGERDLEKEVKQAGVTALKTDVAWVGEGYTFGLNGTADAFSKMKTLGKNRPFIVTLDGWAGTQRFASIWSGDQEGADWQNVKFHIPTYLSTGLSGNPNVGADIDGIYGGGDPIIQTRDLQWKSFTPMQLSMDGWGSKPKDLGIQFGEDFLDINRFYLKLKTTLLPYFYSLAYEARETGAPILRPTFFLEESEYTYGSSLQYQFLLGNQLLIAPIYEPYKLKKDGQDKRNNIYLPQEDTKWYDFFTDTIYKGGQTLSEFDCPLWKLPVFVKEGSILPLVNATNHVQEIDYHTRQFMIYPSETQTCFTVYEDDGKTNGFENEEYMTTMLLQKRTKERILITIKATKGTYKNAPMIRDTLLKVRLEEKPKQVNINGKENTSYTYGGVSLKTYAPKESKSSFSQTTIQQGQFVTIFLEKVALSKEQTIEIICGK